MSIQVLYEDEWLLIINKPAGLLTTPSPKNETHTVTNILNQEVNNAEYNFHPCHRLDRETSGALVYAKGKAMQKKMMELFQNHEIDKEYIAFVHGGIAAPAGEIKQSIEGQSAVTRYKVIERLPQFSVLACYPITGRTNQIRLHLKHIGHPVVGEKRFVFRRDFKLRASRLCLHAYRIKFIHPVTRKPVLIEAPLPEAMQNFLEREKKK